jgi:hypothetical protein
MTNPNDTIGNRTRDFPACRAVPQPTTLPGTLFSNTGGGTACQRSPIQPPAIIHDPCSLTSLSASDAFTSMAMPLGMLALQRIHWTTTCWTYLLYMYAYHMNP